MRGGRQVSNSDRAIMLNKVPRVMSASCSWPRDKSASPQAGSVFLDVFRLSCRRGWRPPATSTKLSYQIPVRLGVGRLLVFGVLTPANAAVADGIGFDLTLTFKLTLK